MFCSFSNKNKVSIILLQRHMEIYMLDYSIYNIYLVIVVFITIYINRGIQRSVIYGIWCSCSINNCRCWNYHRSVVLYKVSVFIIVIYLWIDLHRIHILVTLISTIFVQRIPTTKTAQHSQLKRWATSISSN